MNDIDRTAIAGVAGANGSDPGAVVTGGAGGGLLGERLRDLLALTAAEARVAEALFEGATPREAAEAFGISYNTVHVHLGRVFRKTGTNRQSQLMRLMVRAAGLG